MSNSRVIVVGAGISGLSAAIEALREGHEVIVYERCANPGGVSVSWKRKGYTFEGGIHWLVGSTPKVAQHRIWKDTGALRDNNPIYYKDPIHTYIRGDVRLRLWRDLGKLERELLAFAPEDRKAVKHLVRDIRLAICGFTKPQNLKEFGRAALGIVPFAFSLYRHLMVSTEEYLSMFSNPDIREFLGGCINTEHNAVSLVYTLALYAVGDSGYPEGGSLRMATNMEDRVIELGGTIHYNMPVERVIVEEGIARGVMVAGERVEAEHVIVTMDTRKAIDVLFEKPLQTKWAEKVRAKIESEQCMFLSLGVKCDLSAYPDAMRYNLETPVKLAGNEYKVLWINLYSASRGYAPEGGTAITVLFPHESYDYWSAAKADGSYRVRKEEVISTALEALTKAIPELAGNVEVTDLATPMTYERYCDTFRGGWMSVWRPGGMMPSVPAHEKTIKGLHFAGQRVRLSGGLPIAVATGRRAAKGLK